MKSTNYILLTIGILGLAASIFGVINGGAIQDHLIGIICSASLIYGYLELKNKKNSV
jgi:hypothetical protein